MSALETRNQSYFDERARGELNRRQREIMLALHAARSTKDFSLQEICRLTNLPVNIVSGRVNELKNMSPFPYLVESEHRRCSVTGRTITPVKINKGQMELALERAA